MAEIRREVKPIEVSYLCDECNNGYVHEHPESKTEANHHCVICGHEYQFDGIVYPRIVFVPID